MFWVFTYRDMLRGSSLRTKRRPLGFIYWLSFFRQPRSTTSHPPAPHRAFLLLSLWAASTGSWSVLSAPRSLSTPRPLLGALPLCPLFHPAVLSLPLIPESLFHPRPLVTHPPPSFILVRLHQTVISSRCSSPSSRLCSCSHPLLCKLCRSLLVIKGLLPHSILPPPPYISALISHFTFSSPEVQSRLWSRSSSSISERAFSTSPALQTPFILLPCPFLKL